MAAAPKDGAAKPKFRWRHRENIEPWQRVRLNRDAQTQASHRPALAMPAGGLGVFVLQRVCRDRQRLDLAIGVLARQEPHAAIRRKPQPFRRQHV